MQRTSRKVLDTLISRTKIYLAIIFILLTYIAIQNTYLIVPCILLFASITIYSYYINNKRKSEISETLQDLSISVDSAAKTSLINSPFPLVILENDGNIMWRSSKFVSEFANIDIHTYLKDLLASINRKDEKNQDIIRQIEIDQKNYHIVGKCVQSKNYKKGFLTILYFI